MTETYITTYRAASYNGILSTRGHNAKQRMIDMIAADLGIDRIEFRRKNLITAKEQPYPVATVQPTNAKDEYDSGEYRDTLDRALKEIGWAEKSKLAGKQIDGN